MKLVFTLKSGKSIVVSLYEDQCFKIYNQWVNYIPLPNEVSKATVDKKRNNLISEMVGILLSEIAAIQIVENLNDRSAPEDSAV
jgi:hypothetical protein